MIKTFACAVAAALTLSMLAPGAALASGSQSKAWVSGTGVDGAGCGSNTAPCRTLQYAFANIVEVGGTIYIEGPGGYGPIVITNAISIINDGVGVASIVATPGGDAIDIQIAAGGFDAAVLLKGLTLDGAISGAEGINLTSAVSLTVADCTIKGFGAGGDSGNGILIQPSSGTLFFAISDTVVSGNGNVGIKVVPQILGSSTHAAATIFGSLTRVQAVNNYEGVVVNSTVNSKEVSVVANQVNASENGFVGFEVDSASLYLTRSTATGNGYWFTGYGVRNNGTVYSYGDNAINGNATDVSSALTTTRQLQ